MKTTMKTVQLFCVFGAALYRLRAFAIVTCLSAGFIGCGKSSAPPSATSPTTRGTPATAPILSAWQNGEQSAAVRAFIGTEWTAQPLFEPGSTLALTEQEYAALPTAKRTSDEGKMLATMSELKEVATAVAQAGRDALAKGDTAQARKHFDSLKKCGTAFAAPGRLSLLQLHGKALIRMADTELAKLPR